MPLSFHFNSNLIIFYNNKDNDVARTELYLRTPRKHLEKSAQNRFQNRGTLKEKNLLQGSKFFSLRAAPMVKKQNSFC